MSRWCGLLLLLLMALGLPLVGQAQSEPRGVNRAGIVVRGADGQVHTACVSFTEPTISGMALLERSGFDVNAQVSGSNATVCSIDGVGCRFPQEACFCECQGGVACRYWAYWHLQGGTWQFSASGAPVYRVEPGGVDGWAWGDGSAEEGSRPPAASFAEICPLPESTPLPEMTMVPTLAQPAATRAPSPAATPVRSPVGVAAPESSVPGPDLGRYAFFGVTIGGLVAAIGLAARRRR